MAPTEPVLPSSPLLASFFSFLRQARHLYGMGDSRLASDHAVAALGVAFSVARQQAEAVLNRGGTVAQALDAGLATLRDIRVTTDDPKSPAVTS